MNVKDFSNNIFTRHKYKKQRAKWGFCSYDAMDIDVWFLSIMPRMIEYLRNNHVGFPAWIRSEYYEQNKDKLDMTEKEFFAYNPNETKEQEEFKENADNYCNEKWNEILDRMIFLFDECDDEKCTQQNEFREEYYNTSKKFANEYGKCGEKLSPPKEASGKNKTVTSHSMREVPEYEEIYYKYYEREEEISNYQEKCKKKALEMFVKYFDNLWN